MPLQETARGLPASVGSSPTSLAVLCMGTEPVTRSPSPRSCRDAMCKHCLETHLDSQGETASGTLMAMEFGAGYGVGLKPEVDSVCTILSYLLLPRCLEVPLPRSRPLGRKPSDGQTQVLRRTDRPWCPIQTPAIQWSWRNCLMSTICLP